MAAVAGRAVRNLPNPAGLTSSGSVRTGPCLPPKMGGTMDRKDHDKHQDAAGKNPVLHHDDNPGVGDHVGEAAGGISGVLAGAAIGSAGGPIGTIIGGIAGAVGGWWSGRTVSEAA